MKPEILPGNCKVALYDANMVNTPGVAAKVSPCWPSRSIQVILVTTSEVDISCWCPSMTCRMRFPSCGKRMACEPVQAGFKLRYAFHKM